MSKRTPKPRAGKARKPWTEMSTAELREATKEYDAERVVIPAAKSLPPDAKARYDALVAAARKAQAAGKPISNELPAADKARIKAVAKAARARQAEAKKMGRPVVGEG